MTTFSIVKLCIFLIFFTFTVGNSDPLLAFTGCNATLQWNIYNSSYNQERTDIRIFDNAGDVIAKTGNNQCLSQQNHSVSCIVSNKNNDLIIVLTLINITTNHTGNYTAWLRQDLHVENKSMPLIVIDKPQIKEIGTPVLYQNFSVTCTTSYNSNCLTYIWKINGSDLQDSLNILATMSTLTYRNVTVMDNFNKLTCRAGIEKCSNVVCNSSEDSNPYTVEPSYGPLYVYLSLNERIVSLEENRTFKVKCSASCYPACTYQWESNHINVDNEELVINSFNQGLSGTYICTAKNRKTHVTASSYPLFLQLAKVYPDASDTGKKVYPDASDTGKKEPSIYLLAIGLVIVAICLIILGALMWRKYDSRGLVSVSPADNHPCAGPTNREITQDFLRFKKQDKPLPTPTVPDSSNRVLRRSWYPNTNRKSLSFHSFFNHDQALWRPVRQSLSLQSLIQLSNEIGREANSDDSLSKRFSSKKGRGFSIHVSETRIRPEEIYSKVKKHNKVGYNEENPDEISPSMINIRPHSSAQELQELYSTIDETSLSEYDYPRSNNEHENLQDKQSNTDAGSYDYDYAFHPHCNRL